MDFTYTFFFFIAVVGLTGLIVDSSILQWFRDLVYRISDKLGWQWPKDLTGCYQCVATHCSAIMSLFYNPFPLPWYYSIFLCAFAGSYLAMAAMALLNYLDRPWPATKE